MKKEPYMKKVNKIGYWEALYNLKIVVPILVLISTLLSALALPSIGDALLGKLGFTLGSVLLWMIFNMVGAYVISKNHKKQDYSTKRDWLKAEAVITIMALGVTAMNAICTYAMYLSPAE